MMRLERLLPAAVLLVIVLPAAPGRGADWPRPRGPRGDGRLEATGTFSDGPIGLRLAWKTPLGSGYSGIAVARGHVVTAYSDAEANWVAAFEAETGKALWRQRLGPRHAGHDGSDDGPLSSPAIGDGLVYALDPSGRLAALRLPDGSPAWSRDLPAELGATAPDFGFTTTPLVAGNVLVVQAGGGDGRSIVGLDARTGELRWSAGQERVDYQSPALMTLAGTPQVVAVGRGKIRALAPDTGRVLWEHALGEQDRAGSATPTHIGADRFMVYLGGDAAAFRVLRAEAGFAVEELYRSNALGETYAPPVYHDGHLYGFRGQILSCIKADTGERVWRSRPPGGDGLILVDGNLVLFGAQGHVVVAAATPEGYRERARLQALAGSSLTWPSFADGRVFVRNLNELAAVAVTAAGAPAPRAGAEVPAEGAFGAWVARVEAAPQRAALVDEFWSQHPRLPVVEGEWVHFLWRGPAQDVGLAGSMVDGDAIVPLRRLTGTDLFYRSFRLDPGARWEYRFQLDFERFASDPRNPRSVPAVDDDGTLSELVGAGYTVGAHLTEAAAPATPGTLEEFTLESKALGAEKRIRVWLPPGYAAQSRAYPLLIVNDGAAWLEKGALPAALDRLVGTAVAPLVAVFVPAADAWWLEGGGSRTDEYVRMLATELVPALEQRYRLERQPASRAVLGLRFYGLTAAYAVLRHPDVFSAAGLQSAYTGLGFGDELEVLIAARAGAGARFYLDWNRYEERNLDRDWDLGADSRRLAELLRGAGYALEGGEALDSRGWGGWRNRTDRVLRFLFPLPARPAEDAEGPARSSPANAWFVRQRMSSGEPIPPRARARALEDWSQRTAGRPAATAGSWAFAGPTNIGGRLTAIAVDPHDVSHVWAGAAAGGVFESTDGGTSWSAVFGDEPLQPVGAIAAHPTDSDVVYVGTGEANGAGYSYDGDGVWRTVDGGASWQHLGLAETRRIGRIAIDPQDPSRVFVAAAGGVYVEDGFRGVYRSIDGGASWSRVLFVAPNAGAIDVAIDPANPSRIFAAIWEHYSTDHDWIAGGTNSGIWRSLDGGDSWTRLTAGLPAAAPTIGRIGLAVAASNPQVVYALYIDNPGSFMGVYKTTNGGDSWFRVDTPGGAHTAIFSSYGYYFGQIRVDPANANTVYLLDLYWARSTNGGVSYTNFTSGLHVDHHDLIVRPGLLYMANDGGFYRSITGGSTWTKSPAQPISQFYDLGIDPTNSLKRFGGLQDNGSVKTTDGGLSNWTSVNGGDGFHCEVDPLSPQFVYCESQYGNIVRSTNGGGSFSGGTTGIPAADRNNWNQPIVHDPLTAQRLYTGTHRVFRSTNAAQSWSPISADLTDGPPAHLGGEADGHHAAHLASAVEGTLTTLAVSRVNLNVLWAGTDDGNVWVTTDAGGQWTRVDVPGRSEWVTRLEADPFDAAAAYVTYSGYRNGSPLPRLYRTTDHGQTWSDIGAGLPDVPLNCVNADLDPAMRGRLFVCTDLGVYVSDDYGQSWAELGSGLPRVVVHDLDLIAGTRELFAGTHARSMWLYDLDQLGPADADGDGSHNLADCAPDDAGAFAAPGEVSGLLLGPGGTLSWTAAQPAAGSATVHQVLRGVVGELPVGSGAAETCLVAGAGSAAADDAELPAVNASFWYLVRARNACGAGSWGQTSAGAPRVSAVCPA